MQINEICDLVVEVFNRQMPANNVLTQGIPRVIVNTRLRAIAGKARHRENTIEIAGWLLNAPEADQRNTVLHECAHLLAGPRQGHGPVWKRMAIRVGAKPERCYGAELEEYNKASASRTFYKCADGDCELKFKRRPSRDYTHPLIVCRSHGLRFFKVA